MELRILRETDQALVLEMLTDEQIKQTYMLPDFSTREDALPLFRRLVQLSRNGSHFVRGICDGDVLVGFLNDVQTENGCIELGYVIHPRHWGKGYATEGLKLALEELARLATGRSSPARFPKTKPAFGSWRKHAWYPSPELTLSNTVENSTPVATLKKNSEADPG